MLNGLAKQSPRDVMLLHRQYGPGASALRSTLIMTGLVLCVYCLQIPNPNIFLLSGLVVCSALYGYPGGLISGGFMLAYTLFFFSTDHDFLTFTTQNRQKVLVSCLGIVADVAFICRLKQTEQRAFARLEQLTELLREDKRALEAVSVTDQLTQLGNRLALRSAAEGVWGKDVAVMIVDVDDFKSVNDLHGHDAGDRCLRETGRVLTALFGRSHAYRYGGDEFVVLCPDSPLFAQKAATLTQNPPSVALGDGTTVRLSYSAGYVLGHCRDGNDLHSMFIQADSELYRSKKNGKGRVTGGAYLPSEGGIGT